MRSFIARLDRGVPVVLGVRQGLLTELFGAGVGLGAAQLLACVLGLRLGEAAQRDVAPDALGHASWLERPGRWHQGCSSGSGRLWIGRAMTLISGAASLGPLLMLMLNSAAGSADSPRSRQPPRVLA